MNRFTDIIYIDKVVYLGTYKENNRNLPIFCKVKYKNGRLSISGVVAPKANGNAWGSSGQINDEIAKNLNRIKWATNWDKSKAFQFIEYWKEWHLNYLQAGCEHQRAAKWEDQLASETHPQGLLMKPCPVCGYKYGSEWKTKEVPQKVLKFLQDLPENEKNPAWI